MTPPISPSDLQRILKTLPPEAPDPFTHLATLTPTALLKRRVEITGQLKTLEQERQAIDAELRETFSDAELKMGVRAPGGWVLKQRSRTCWEYAPEIKETIRGLQQQAQRDGRAQMLASTYLVAIQESA